MALHTLEICSGVGMLGEGLRMRPILGLEGRYSATEDGRIYSHFSARFLRPSTSGRYEHVSVGHKKTRAVHVLVLLAFKGRPPAGMVARHLDGNSKNNKATNLVWSTQRENMLDKNAHGTMVRGELHHSCKVTDAVVVKIKQARADGRSYPQIGNLFGISTSQAHRICTNQNRLAVQCG